MFGFTGSTKVNTGTGSSLIEVLNPGDIVLNHKKEYAPVLKVSRYLTSNDDGSKAQLVCIMKDAFGLGQPSGDLYLSSKQAIVLPIIDLMSIEVGLIVNNSSVSIIKCENVALYSLNTGLSQTFFANDLLALSYRDLASSILPDSSATSENRPRDISVLPEPISAKSLEENIPHLDPGAKEFLPTVGAIKHLLDARAGLIGCIKSHDMDVHLVVDGTRVNGDQDGSHVRFLLPASANEVLLRSETFMPEQWNIPDKRKLGISISNVFVTDGLHVEANISLDDEHLRGCFYSQETNERQPWRWTNGECRLPAVLWAGAKSHVMLRITLDRMASNRWVAPIKQSSLK